MLAFVRLSWQVGMKLEQVQYLTMYLLIFFFWILSLTFASCLVRGFKYNHSFGSMGSTDMKLDNLG